MQSKKIYKILVSLIIMIAIICLSVNVQASALVQSGSNRITNASDKVDELTSELGGSSGDASPAVFDGSTSEELDLSDTFFETITDAISSIGIFIAVGALMIIGIRYMVGSVEEKAEYKKTMMPYIVGCFILFAASAIIPAIEELFSDLGSDAETVGNNILGIIQTIGTLIAVGAIMFLGIKYMMGGAEERAEYKKTMLPYIIGFIILLAAVNLTAVIYDLFTNVGGEETASIVYMQEENIKIS